MQKCVLEEQKGQWGVGVDGDREEVGPSVNDRPGLSL